MVVAYPFLKELEVCTDKLPIEFAVTCVWRMVKIVKSVRQSKYWVHPQWTEQKEFLQTLLLSFNDARTPPLFLWNASIC